VIFVTVGTQLPFDRLIAAVDAWAQGSGVMDVVAQIGPASYEPRHMRHERFMSPPDCERHMREADVIVAHAGMGTILNALQMGKPLVVMPRRASLGEHRNDHQLATAQRFAELGSIVIAHDGDALAQQLDALQTIVAADRISPYASERLINALSAFIATA
jgi:UDP-N-acetylglucosamine transferase subunit ALG13